MPRVAPTKVSVFTTAGRNELYGDAFNDAVIVGPGKRFTAGLATFDPSVVDGGSMGTASAFGGISGSAAPRPERLRPLLRAVRCSPAPPSSSSPSWW